MSTLVSGPFPNPATNGIVRFTVQSIGHDRITCTLVGISGEVISSQSIETRPDDRYSFVADASGLPSGTYFVRVDYPRGTITRGFRVVR